jgi:hypothetical protein
MTGVGRISKKLDIDHQMFAVYQPKQDHFSFTLRDKINVYRASMSLIGSNQEPKSLRGDERCKFRMNK